MGNELSYHSPPHPCRQGKSHYSSVREFWLETYCPHKAKVLMHGCYLPATRSLSLPDPFCKQKQLQLSLQSGPFFLHWSNSASNQIQWQETVYLWSLQWHKWGENMMQTLATKFTFQCTGQHATNFHYQCLVVTPWCYWKFWSFWSWWLLFFPLPYHTYLPYCAGHLSL